MYVEFIKQFDLCKIIIECRRLYINSMESLNKTLNRFPFRID